MRIAMEDGFAKLMVCDQGIGIADADRTQLFARFGRGDNAVAYQIRGTGLSLYVVGEIVRLHRRRVEVDSAEGESSTFTVVLPLQDHGVTAAGVADEAPVVMRAVNQSGSTSAE